MSIELRNVTKQFGQVAAVSNVSFSVNEGELMALLGPSGGGKVPVRPDHTRARPFAPSREASRDRAGPDAIRASDASFP